MSLLEEADGWRYGLFVTNTRTGQLYFLEARHRVHARVEDRIRSGKSTGLGRLLHLRARPGPARLTPPLMSLDRRLRRKPPTSARGTDADPTRQPGRTAAQQLENMIDKTAEDRLHTDKTRSRLTRD
ncbi:hypothetical protein FHR32_001548 [Streptosporangium album]|uniref:Uncharacterized protein n=1 Tax=Streptosporangium album TaxID=47479 RepID=A0A7W7W7V3_9ACTN|nr:hypothetical protein [Streptosporangium album]MBB4937243.1 hypothetical protein [Streptosporangium album]